MKIISLRAENIKRLSVVEISPKGHVVEITGKNGNGKTSVLDSLWWAIEGATHIQRSPIRDGANEAVIKLDLGEDKPKYTIVRQFTRQDPKTSKDGKAYTTKLRITDESGADKKGPQAILDTLYGALTFDPLQFSRAGAKEQFDALRKLVPGVDFDQLEGQNRADYQERTDVGRKRDEAKAAASIIVVSALTPDTMADIGALQDQLAGAADHNALVEKRKAKREGAATEITRLRAAARLSAERVPIIDSDLKVELERLKSEYDRRVTEANDRSARDASGAYEAERLATLEAEVLQNQIDTAEPLPDLMDIAKIRADLDAAAITNALVEKRARKTELEAVAAGHAAKWDEITARMEARDKAKAAAIASAQLPVPGLGLGDGFVTLDGQPFEQASDAQRLRVSVAVAMGANPALRVMRIRDGSLLDTESWKALEEMVAAADFQVWVESVESTRETAIEMVDGHVKAKQGELV